MPQIWVLEYDGIPPAEVFNSASGFSTPVVINTQTDRGYYYKNSVGVTPLAAGDEWTYVYLTSDYPVVASSPVVIPGLAFAPEASSTYLVEAQLLVQTDTLNNGPSPGVDWPGGISLGGIKISIPEGSTGEALFNGNHLADGRAVPATFPASAPFLSLINSTFTMGGSPSGNFSLTISSAS